MRLRLKLLRIIPVSYTHLAQVAPPKKYFAAAFSRAAEEWRLERLLPSVPLFPSHPSPFLSENENAAACQAFRPVCVCMVSCV